MHIEEAKIQPGYIIQVIVNPEKLDDSPVKTSWTNIAQDTSYIEPSFSDKHILTCIQSKNTFFFLILYCVINKIRAAILKWFFIIKCTYNVTFVKYIYI